LLSITGRRFWLKGVIGLNNLGPAVGCGCYRLPIGAIHVTPPWPGSPMDDPQKLPARTKRSGDLRLPNIMFPSIFHTACVCQVGSLSAFAMQEVVAWRNPNKAGNKALLCRRHEPLKIYKRRASFACVACATCFASSFPPIRSANAHRALLALCLQPGRRHVADAFTPPQCGGGMF
jgi:hypothetical protein